MTIEEIEARCRNKADELISKYFDNIVKETAIERSEEIGDYNLELPNQIEAEYKAYLKELWIEIAPCGSPSFEEIIDKQHVSDGMTEDDRDANKPAYDVDVRRTLWEQLTGTNQKDMTCFKGLLKRYTEELLLALRCDFLEEVRNCIFPNNKKNMLMKKKTDQLQICRKENVVYFSLLFLLSIVIGCSVYGCFSKLFLGDNKTTPDFFMNWYNTKKASYKSKPAFDTIVLIDADNLNRRELAVMLSQLYSMQPKVIGFDILLEEERESQADAMLFEVFQQCHPNIVFPVYVDDKDSLRAPFFKNKSQNDFYYGSVVFDNPWESRTKQGDYSSFAYLIAKLYLEKEIDTSSFIVDYTPMTLNERIYYDKVACSFMYLDKQKPNVPNLRGKIVLIGTLDRTSDAVNMRFPVRYDQSSKPQYVIPGMVSLSYEIRSMVDEGHRIKKMNKLWSFVLNIILIVMYLLLYITFSRFTPSNQYLHVIMPLFGLVFILFLEWLLVMFTFFVTDQFGQMPNLGVFMATLPVVKTADEIVSRYLGYKFKINNNKSN